MTTQHSKTSKSSERDEWRTPRWLFDKLNDVFDFQVDLAADEGNALCEKFFSQHNPMSNYDWDGAGWHWCNPPFSLVSQFVGDVRSGGGNTVMILPANRCEQQWFHEAGADAVCFIRKRVNYDPPEGIAASSAKFGSMLLIWGDLEDHQKDLLKTLGVVFTPSNQSCAAKQIP